VIGLLVAAALLAPPSATGPTDVAARSFLDALAADPSKVKAEVTDDAVMAIGDIGLPFNDYVKLIQQKANWLKGCQVDQLKKVPVPSAEDHNNRDLPPGLKRGAIRAFEGAYACSQPDGSRHPLQFVLVFRDSRVAELLMGQHP